jgi:hypothetical protein
MMLGGTIALLFLAAGLMLPEYILDGMLDASGFVAGNLGMRPIFLNDSYEPDEISRDSASLPLYLLMAVANVYPLSKVDRSKVMLELSRSRPSNGELEVWYESKRVARACRLRCICLNDLRPFRSFPEDRSLHNDAYA